jgi:hypothetical protein
MYRFHVDVDVPPAVGVKMTRIGPDGGGGGKTHSLLFAFLIIGVVLGFSFLASAKPQKFKLTIEGGRLSKPIEVTDPQILELSYFRLPAPQPPDGRSCTTILTCQERRDLFTRRFRGRLGTFGILARLLVRDGLEGGRTLRPSGSRQSNR